MVYYKCIVCDVKWSKLADDGCLVCESPCQIIEDYEDEAQLNRRGRAGLSMSSPASAVLSTDELQAMSPFIPPLNIAKNFLEEDQKSIGTAGAENAIDLVEHEKMECALALLTLRYSDSSDARSHTNDINTSHSKKSGKTRPGPRTARFTEVFDTAESSFNSAFGQDDTYDSKGLAAFVDAESISNEPPDMSLKTWGPLHETKAGKKKKKAKKTGNQGRKQPPTASPQKVLPKLELPDPVPIPTTNKSGEGQWNEVVKKGVAKAAKKIQNSAKEKENVNASSYLFRSDEIEASGFDHSAIAVRISMGGTKHDVRRVIPRSALE